MFVLDVLPLWLLFALRCRVADTYISSRSPTPFLTLSFCGRFHFYSSFKVPSMAFARWSWLDTWTISIVASLLARVVSVTRLPYDDYSFELVCHLIWRLS